MARVVDITDKLTFEGNPMLTIKKKELEVNADAPTMIKVMGMMGADTPGMDEILNAYDLIFPEASKKEIDDLKLDFRDLIVVIRQAIQLIVGDVGDQGE